MITRVTKNVNMGYYACLDLNYTWGAVYVILYSCGAYVLNMLTNDLIMENGLIKGLICDFCK